MDGDKDGLSDDKEIKIGTDPEKIDTDGDEITDYDEVTKYYLNPLLADSDKDGVLDTDQNERREFSHTLKAVIKLRPPFDTNSMNDHFQDITVIEETPTSLTFEVVFYPNARHIVEEIPFEETSEWYEGLNNFLASDALMNFDKEMSSETIKLFTSGEKLTDLKVVKNMYNWEERNVEAMPETSNRSAPYPEPFLDFYVTKDDEIVFPKKSMIFSKYSSDMGVDYSIAWERDWQMTHLILGKEMFENHTHGSCGSTANFHSTILRSLGIPTRIIQTIPILDTSKARQMNLLDSLSAGTKSKLISNIGYNHFLVEAFIGNRWIRINNSSFEDHIEMGGVFIKIIAFDSWKEIDFANSWGRSGRPYSLVEIEEQKPIHEPIIYDFSK